MDGVDDQQQKNQVVQGHHNEVDRRQHRVYFWGAVILLAAAMGAAPAAYRSDLPLFLACYLIATAVWFVLLLHAGVKLHTVLLIGLLLRLMLALQDPLLSPDLWRYQWEGKVWLSGSNPYALPPSDPGLTHLRDETFDRIQHGEVRSVYPPFAQLIFVTWAALGGHILVWRLLVGLFEILTAILLFRRSPFSALLYACSPFVILEGFWSGHMDVIAAGLLLAACLGASRRPASAGVLLGITSGIKIIPAAAFPALVRSAGRWFGLAFALMLGIPLAIFAAFGGVMTGLPEYTTRWSFNSPLFTATRAVVERLFLDQALKSIWTVVKGPLHLEPVSNGVYRHLHPDFIARCVLAVMVVIGIAIVVKQVRSPLAAAMHSVGLLILFSPTIHPWYWLTLFPLALSLRNWFWITLPLASPASYLLYSATSDAAVVFIVSYLPAGLLLALQLASDFRARVISRSMASRGDSPS